MRILDIKKVVHISTLHQTFDQRVFHRECISLYKFGFDVSLLVHYDGNEGPHEGVKIISLGASIKNKARLRILSRIRVVFLALIKALRVKADIYHVHDPELLAIVPMLKLLSRAKIIYDCHEDHVGFMLQKPQVPVFLRKGLSKLMELLEYHTARLLDAIITADPGVEKKFMKTGAKTLTLYNFPRLEFFSLPDLAEKEYDLVYHGSIPRYHMEVCFAIDEVLSRRQRELRWLFIGSFGDKTWSEKTIAAISAAHRFTLYDRIAHDKIANEVRKARIGIIPLPDLPKFQYNIPTKLFEFMALKMPVVMSDLPPSRPFVKDGKCGIMVSPHDYEAYAEAIINLLDDPELCARMGKAGRSRVDAEYNWNREERKLVNLYNSLTENNN